MIVPQDFHWNGEAMIPNSPRHAKRQFTDGEVYRLGPIEERSGNSHRFYFAAINQAWENLPEELAPRFPSPDHLRRHALIKAGYADVQEFAASSKAEALRLAAFVRGIDDYAVVNVKGSAVQRFTAKSQSYRAMGKADFEASKNKVLEIVSQMIGVTPDALQRSRAA